MIMLSLWYTALLLIGTDSVDNSEIIYGSNDFGYDLSNKLFIDSSTNIWISPFCITSCFALIYPGSDGQTQTQIADVLSYPTSSAIDTADITQQFFTLQTSIESTYNGIRSNSEDSKPSIIGIANKIYSSRGLTLKQTYIDALNDETQSFIDYNFDFSANNATTIINEWVKKNTNGLIEEIIPEQQSIESWRLVAINAIYLNGSFSSQFETSQTSLQSFYTNSLRKTEVADCHLMHQMNEFDYYSDGNYQFVKFPFSDSSDLFVLFALPINHNLYDEENKNGLITDADVIKTAIEKLETEYIALALPKISITATYTLNDILVDLGMIDAFDSNADFSGISDTALLIDSVIHKTMVEMDEKGLVAAAVTLIAMREMAAVEEPTPILFKADHPFQMFIIDGEHEDNILFMGQINDPGIPEGSATPQYDESTDATWSNFKLYNNGAVRYTQWKVVILCAVMLAIYNY